MRGFGVMRFLIAFLAALFSALAFAPRAEALICISLLGPCSCEASVSDITFAPFNPLTATQQEAIGVVDISCTGTLGIGSSVTVEILNAPSTSGGVRQMLGPGGQVLHYRFYTQGGQVWGQGAQGVTLPGPLLTIAGWSTHADIFARFTPTPTLRPGDYSETVTVRITY
ncbi:MAG TPA: spore coat protein U domain-containing protein [Terricaulis sp.]|nr:spore coat protein U domain-containing protein [Terricaulis sp.]